MNYPGSLLRRRLVSCSRSYYFCWALPLLRLCLSTTTSNHLGIHYFSSAPSHCLAFSPAQTSKYLQRQRLQSDSLTSWWLAAAHKNQIPLLMARKKSTSSLRGKTSSSDELPETDQSPSKRSSPRKRSREPASPSKDWSALKVVELKEELKSRGLKTTGLKADLVASLEESDEEMSVASPKKKRKAKAPPSSPKRKAASPKKKAASPKRKAESPKKKAGDHQRITEIDDLPKLWTDEMAKENGSYSKFLRFVTECDTNGSNANTFPMFHRICSLQNCFVERRWSSGCRPKGADCPCRLVQKARLGHALFTRNEASGDAPGRSKTETQRIDGRSWV